MGRLIDTCGFIEKESSFESDTPKSKKKNNKAGENA